MTARQVFTEKPTISGKARVCHLPHNLLSYDPDLKRRILKPNLKWDSCMLESVVLVDMIRTWNSVGDLARKRQGRKERQRTASGNVACPTCGQLCASEFGLRSHQRRHWTVLLTTTAIQEWWVESIFEKTQRSRNNVSERAITNILHIGRITPLEK